MIFLAVSGFLMPHVSAMDPSSVTVKQVKPVYKFSEHLGEAETLIMVPERTDLVGKWDGNQFLFENMSPLFAVQQTVQTYNQQLKEGISLKPVPEASRRLRFYHVTPGSSMRVYYGFQDDSQNQTKENSNVYLTAWAGKHLLARMAIPNKPGWNMTVLDLGVVTFLLKDIVVTFDVSVDEKTERQFAFNAEILP
jgi:hypothetical protein